LPTCPDSGVFHHCFGSWTWEGGTKYVGEWWNDKKNGQGVFTFGSSIQWAGDKYVGEFKEDQYHRQDTYTWADEAKYVGQFNSGKQHGPGTFSDANGNKYVGDFKDDLFHGQGIFTFADGRVEEGIWENGEFLYARQLTPDAPNNLPATTRSPNKLVTAASGSGFAVSSSGHVITNNHVIHGCSDIKIHHDGNTTKARVIAQDAHNDLALLKGDFKPSTVLPLSRDNLQLLQEIYVAGFPFGQEISSSIKVTRGIVSSLTGIQNNESEIQIDASLQPGNSGGPIIDENGNVVAVAVAKLDLMAVMENSGVVPENTNFGVKSTVVVNLLQNNDVTLRAPNSKTISKTTLGKSISDATYYLSCWMTMAQIERLRPEKVMFNSFE